MTREWGSDIIDRMNIKNTLQELIYPSALHRQLEDILTVPLSLLMAGSGFGKTTAVSHYLNYYLPGHYECHFYTCFDEPPRQSWSGSCGCLLPEQA